MSEIAGSLVGGTALNIRETDGSPSMYPYQLKVSNGTLTNNGDGTATLATGGVVGGGSFADREIPTGTINGSNVTFTLANSPTVGSEHMYLNGVLQESGGADYSISSTTITFVIAPETGSVILVSYRY